MTSTSPELSIVIPCYNAAAWLSRAVESVLSQADSRVELIVVNDGSSDESGSLLAMYGNRIHVIDQENAGVSAARNVGVRRCTGAFVRFLDADDEVAPGSLKPTLAALEKAPPAVLVARSRLTDEAGCVLESDAYNIPALFRDGQVIPPEYLFTQPTSSCLWLLPREIVLASGGFRPDIRLGEEFHFTRQLVRTGVSFRFLEQTITHVRRHDGFRLSRVASERDYLAQLQSIQECLRDLHARVEGPASGAIQSIAIMCWSLGRQCFRLGYSTAGVAYIREARALAGHKAATGHAIYKALAAVVAPEVLENAMSGAKRVLKLKGKAVRL